jgi:hypothetical protein
MSSQNHYTNLCKTLYFSLFCLIKLSRPDQRIVLVHVCVCIASSRTTSTVYLKFSMDIMLWMPFQ